MSWRSKQLAIEIRKQLQKGAISHRAKPYIGGRAIYLVDKSCLKVMIWSCTYYLSCWACEIRNFLDIAHILEVLPVWLRTMQTEHGANWRILGMVEETTYLTSQALWSARVWELLLLRFSELPVNEYFPVVVLVQTSSAEISLYPDKTCFFSMSNKSSITLLI